MGRVITIAHGPCAVESEKQIWSSVYQGSLIQPIVTPYDIKIAQRGGCWKPRTELYTKNNGVRKVVFEGTREEGLRWMAEALNHFGLPGVVEIMSEADLRHFERHLEPDRDYLQIGARDSQAFALMYAVGSHRFGALHKHPQHGVDPKEAIGSLQRYENNRQVIYCIRGQKRPGSVDGRPNQLLDSYLNHMHSLPGQHKDTRNLNNIEAVNIARDSIEKNPIIGPKGILMAYDPSHTFGGKTHQMRRMIGEQAIRAIKEFCYDWLLLEVADKTREAKCDGDQHLVTTLNGIDWSETSALEEPPADQMQISLVEIVKDAMAFQVASRAVSIPPEQIEADMKRLDAIVWGASP